MDNKELRSVILALVKACNRSRRNLMAANMVIEAISSMSPDERKALRVEYIKTERKKIEQQLALQPDPAGVRIEKMLAEDEDYLKPLRDFAAELHW
jgi:hypothetical protein